MKGGGYECGWVYACVFQHLNTLSFPVPRCAHLFWLFPPYSQAANLLAHLEVAGNNEEASSETHSAISCDSPCLLGDIVCAYSLSPVPLFVTTQTVAHQSPLSMGFSRAEHWSGLPRPPPGDLPNQELNPGLPHCRQILYHLSHQGSPGILQRVPYAAAAAAAAAKSLQSCPTLCDPIDGSPPGSPIPGILQARTLEWVAISFSSEGK